jgi:predicted nucleotidyltransferase
MNVSSVEAIVRALNQAEVRYVIAGGLAVVAHGYVRFTADIDILLAMDADNLAAATKALQELSYRPRAPVPMEQLLDPAMRQAWIREKGLTVFSLFSVAHPATEVDIFLDAPLDFEAMYARSVELDLVPGIPARFCGLDDLIAMKRQAGRSRDVEDIRQLGSLKERPDGR